MICVLWAFINKKGNLVGLEIDIAHKLAEELLGDAEAVEFLPVTNKERLQVVLDERVDMAIVDNTVII
nr:transporter substrate-binding domain-containing protein [Pleurocapsa sp. FMAR1]